MKNNSFKWHLHHGIPTLGHGEDYASEDTKNVTMIITLSLRYVLIAAGEILPLASLQDTERDGDEAQIAVSPNPTD